MSAPPRLSRRGFLVGAVLVGATGALADLAMSCGSAFAVSQVTTTAWTLDPDWGYPRGARGRTSCSCRACRSHATNKIFATPADAADPLLRAHGGCLCVPTAVSISVKTYDLLFLTGSGSVDRRAAAVAAILDSGNPPTSKSASVGALVSSRTPAGVVDAESLRGVRAGVGTAGGPRVGQSSWQLPGAPLGGVSRTPSAGSLGLLGSAVASPHGAGPGHHDEWPAVGLVGVTGAAVLSGLIWLRQRPRSSPAVGGGPLER